MLRALSLLTATRSHSPGPEAVRLVDLGGGTGNFTQALVDFNALEQRPLCVDPFQDMLNRAVGYPAVDTCCCGAVEFAQQVDRQYDRVLLKVRRRRRASAL